MGAAKYSNGYLTDARKVAGALTVWDVAKLRDSTPIGSEIEFKIKINSGQDHFNRVSYKTIRGVVTAKYDHVFVLDNKHTYDWKQYLLGKVN